ncbi:GH-E family nuclease, partial [Kribbella sp. NPDC020789]
SAQVANEEEKDTAGTWKISKSYAYGANGENLSLVDTPVNTTTTKKSYYGLNPHGDTETLTDATTGQTTSTYRYTAYGQPDKIGTTGDDAITGDPAQDADTVNPYRFNGKRFNGATGTYDMGFREYNPGLNRFLTRDMYAGALSDVSLGTDPWNSNRYAFGGGNPITNIEIDGHYAIDENGERISSETPLLTLPTTTKSTEGASTEQDGPGESPADWQRDHPDAGNQYELNREALGDVLVDVGWMGLGATVAAAGGAVDGGGVLICGGSAGLACPVGAIAIVGGVAISATGAAITTAGARQLGDDWGQLLKTKPGDPAGRRVKLRVETKQKIQDAAPKDANGNFIDPNTGQVIPKGDPFHYGHKPGFEWWRTRERARQEGWSREQVIEYENDWTHYQIEDPASNMSHFYEMPRPR